LVWKDIGHFNQLTNLLVWKIRAYILLLIIWPTTIGFFLGRESFILQPLSLHTCGGTGFLAHPGRLYFSLQQLDKFIGYLPFVFQLATGAAGAEYNLPFPIYPTLKRSAQEGLFGITHRL
jgi:hypothetical protein